MLGMGRREAKEASAPPKRPPRLRSTPSCLCAVSDGLKILPRPATAPRQRQSANCACAFAVTKRNCAPIPYHATTQDAAQ